MPQTYEPLEHDKYYHIYNCGINGENIFREKENYLYFLKLYDKYIEPIAETFAWCLMPNHFHVLVRIKEEKEIDKKNLPTPVRVSNPDRDLSNTRIKHPSKYFSDLFNAYAQAYNKRFNRHGSLLERPFKRKLIDSEIYYKNLVIYINNNPVHHGFVEHTSKYSWTSYLSLTSHKPTKLKRADVIEWFDDLNNFKILHYKNDFNSGINKYLIE